MQLSYKCILKFMSRENAVEIVKPGVDNAEVAYTCCSLFLSHKLKLTVLDVPIWVPHENTSSKVSAFGAGLGCL